MPQQHAELVVLAGKLRVLGEELKGRKIELKQAAELANIYGKEAKVQQLILAERIFEKDVAHALSAQDSSKVVAIQEKK